MAASLSRPDPSSPASVAEASFSTTRRGFSPDEVRAFLVSVAAEMGRLQERERQLEAELRRAEEAVHDVELDEDTVTKLLGEETLRVLQTARESASQIRVRAEENAARTVREAAEEANRLRQDLEVEVARKRQDATSDAEAEVALAKQQGREMVNEARAYRERVLADLDRRTTLARQQIEELIHGRDRLLQVFERARLVAVDVTSELKAVDAPDELVNLTPTTGPVPIMVPQQRRVDAEHDDEAPSDPDATDAIDVPEVDDTIDDDTRPDDAEEAADVAVDEPAADVETTDDEATEEAAVDDAVEESVVEESVDETDGTPDDAPTADDASAESDAESGAESNDDDTNVVSLFRGRPTPVETAVADDHPSTEVPVISADGDTDDAHDTHDGVDDAADETVAANGKPDVGGIFERLRHEVPAAVASAEHATDDEIDDDLHEASGEDARDEVDGPSGEAGDAEPSPFSRRDETIVPLIVAGARRLKRVLADEQNGALDTLRRREPVIALDAVVPALDEHASTYIEALADDLLTAAAAGAAELGVSDTKALRTTLRKSGALDGSHDRVRLALVTPLRDRLGRAIADGDGDNDEITKRVRAVYREWKTQHIDDQLDDIFRRAFAGGLAAVVEPASPLVWTIDPSTSACPDCEDNSLAGAVPAGDEFPTGHRSAPAHPGCRCLTLPST